MASMLQQLGNTKTDKQLTINDLGRISYASCLNLFHTHSVFKDWPMGIYYCVVYYYVKRIDADNYTYQYLWISTGNTAKIKSDFKDYINMTYRAEQTKKLNLMSRLYTLIWFVKIMAMNEYLYAVIII